MSYYEWRPYVPVAKRRARAAREMQKLVRKGTQIDPVNIAGQKIAKTFWGKAWCSHLEGFSDYANRLPRGRTYVRNGSVCHLQIDKGRVRAIVSGSELYHVDIDIAPLPARKWKAVRSRCAGHIGSMLELLEGRFSRNVMEIVTHREQGLFPLPKEIKLACDCPDWAVMCKHVAATLYAIGARLDDRPELLFLLRDVDHEELIGAELNMRAATEAQGKHRRLAGQDLSELFGVDIEATPEPGAKKARPAGTRSRSKAKAPATAAVTRTRTGTSTPRPGKAAVSRNKQAESRAANGRTRRVAATRGSSIGSAGNRALVQTAAAVARLRKRLGMNRSQFARLLGVSPAAVSKWETAKGRLNLHQRTKDALSQASTLTEAQAWARLQ